MSPNSSLQAQHEKINYSRLSAVIGASFSQNSTICWYRAESSLFAVGSNDLIVVGCSAVLPALVTYQPVGFCSHWWKGRLSAKINLESESCFLANICSSQTLPWYPSQDSNFFHYWVKYARLDVSLKLAHVLISIDENADQKYVDVCSHDISCVGRRC